MRNILQRCSALAAALLLSACAANSAAPAAETAQPLPALQTYSAPAPTQEVSLTDPLMEKFIDVLEGIYYDNVLPDGQRLDPFVESEAEFPNEFAIFDVDGDGEDELIVRYLNTYSAGKFGVVYGYDRDSGKLTTQLMDFCALSFYENGTVEVAWSHNQGLSGRFWPRSFYQYDPQSDTYRPYACVDAWDREFFETGFDGEPFPAQADPDGDNIVYYIYRYGSDARPEPISQQDYNAWYNDLVGFDPDLHTSPDFALVLPFQPLSEDNIDALS